MLYALGVLAFAVGLLASIALHEIGHLVPAKKFGVRVTQYMVGFGPTIFSRHGRETEYGIKAIPLGGYIRMIGMVPPRAAGKRFHWPRRLGDLVEEFRATSRTEVTAADEHRQFYRLTPGKKMIIMLGGPSMNLLIFLLISILLYGVVGLKVPTTTIGSVSQCVVPVTATVDTCPKPGTPGYQPAPAAGVLRPGDKITAIDGTPIKNWDDAVHIIENSANKTVSIAVRRDGKPLTLSLSPVENTKFVDATSNRTKQAGFIGVTTTEHYQPLGPGELTSQIWQQLGLGVEAVKQFPSKIGGLVGTVFEGKPRDKAGAVGVVGLGRIGGQIADSKQVDALDKIFTLLSLLAGVNLLLFFLNLLPLLPLDGGHVAGAIVESIRRGIARLRHRDHRIFVDVAQLVPVMYVVAGFLVLFSALVMYADIVKPISLTN